MLMYNLLEYSKNYRKSLWNYYRDEPGNPLSSNSKSFKYKTSITGNSENVDTTIADRNINQTPNPGYDANKVGKNETEVVFPLKHLSNFWRTLNIPLINCEAELILNWSENCVLADLTVANNPPTKMRVELKDTKLYVPVVKLSKGNDTKLLEQLKSGFKRTVKWNKYRSQMTVI